MNWVASSMQKSYVNNPKLSNLQKLVCFMSKCLKILEMALLEYSCLLSAIVCRWSLDAFVTDTSLVIFW